MEALDEKQPEIDEAVRQVNDLCANQPIEDDDAMMLEDTLQELNRYWNELRSVPKATRVSLLVLRSL